MHAAGVRRKAPAGGRSASICSDRASAAWGLANLGFQHMMPNARLFELKRFSGRDDAVEATRASSRLEAAIPKDHRPDLVRHAEGRIRMIDDR